MTIAKRTFNVLWVIFLAGMLLSACTPSTAAAVSTGLPTLAPTQAPSPAPTGVPEHKASWTVFTDSNNIHTAALARDGTLWTAGPGGVTAWNIGSGAFIHYTVLDGLSTNQVEEIAAAPDGLIWAATKEGIQRFDGMAWKTFTTGDGLSSKNVTAVAVAPNGTVWAGTSFEGPDRLGGLAYFTGSGWQSRTCDNGLDDGIRSIAFDTQGGLWLATGIGVVHILSPDQPCDALRIYGPPDGLPDGAVFDVAVTQSGEVWAASDSGAARLEGSGWKIFTTNDGLVHNQVLDIAQAADGKLWFATPGGFSSFDGIHWESFAAGELREDNLVYTLTFSADNLLWAGTQTGLVRFDGQNRQRFLVSGSLPVSASDVLAIDPSGILWAGGSDLGFLRYDGAQWEKMSTGYDSSSHSIQSIAFGPDGSAWVSSWQGVTHFIGNTTQLFDWPDGPVDNNPRPLAVTPDGTVWAGGGRGLLRLNGNTWEQVFPAEKTGVIYALLADPDESLWLGTEGSLDHTDGKQVTSDNAGGWLETNQALALLRSSDAVLVVGTSEGLLAWDGRAWSQYPVEGRVQALTMGTDGAMWASVAASGVQRFDGQAWEAFTTADGLVDNEIHAMAAAPDGSIWFASPGGIGRYQP